MKKNKISKNWINRQRRDIYVRQSKVEGYRSRAVYKLKEIDNKFKVHHYSDEDYKEIFFLQAKEQTTKECLKHSKMETVEYKNIHREGKQQRDYTISNPYPIQDTPQQDTFNNQRPK